MFSPHTLSSHNTQAQLRLVTPAQSCRRDRVGCSADENRLTELSSRLASLVWYLKNLQEETDDKELHDIVEETVSKLQDTYDDLLLWLLRE